MSCDSKIKSYALPDISFVGGCTADFEFNLKNESGNPYNAEGFKAYLTVAPRRKKEVCFSLECSLGENDDGAMSVLKTEISPQETLSLEGEFIYQLTLINSITKKVMPHLQGRMFIGRNINPELVLEG